MHESTVTEKVTLPAGPWAWRDFGSGAVLLADHGHRHIILAGAGGRLVTRNADNHLEPLTPEHPAARAIEAVPELLEACALFTAAAHDVRDLLNGRGLACPGSIALAAEKARHALAKAEGKA